MTKRRDAAAEKWTRGKKDIDGETYSAFRAGWDARDKECAEILGKLEAALDKVQHAVANAWEWQVSDPEDSEMDRDQQIGNWCEKACGEINEAREFLKSWRESDNSGGGDERI